MKWHSKSAIRDHTLKIVYDFEVSLLPEKNHGAQRWAKHAEVGVKPVFLGSVNTDYMLKIYEVLKEGTDRNREFVFSQVNCVNWTSMQEQVLNFDARTLFHLIIW